MVLSDKSMIFLKEEIFPKMQITEITQDNAGLIVDYIVDHYEIPLSQAKEAGEMMDEEVLKTASDTVTEITKEW